LCFVYVRTCTLIYLLVKSLPWSKDIHGSKLFFYRNIIRPCVRWNFPNFSFSQVLEKFGCRSSEIFRKKTEFSNSQKFRKKVWKSSEIIKKCTEILKILKKVWKVWVVKNPVFWVKKFGKNSEILETGFSECLEISEIVFLEIVFFWNFQKLRKNELRKLRKTRSDSKTDSKARLKVWNAGPYNIMRQNVSCE